MPEISIILPCYNVSKWVDRCMDSLIRQTLDPELFEIVAVNDCSTDDTLSKLKKWEADHPERILLVDCPQNGHLGTARNIGMSYASGKWIAFVDSDDWLEPDYLEKLYTRAQQGDYDIVSCREGRDSSAELTRFTDRSTGKKDTEYRIETDAQRREFFRLQPMKLYAWGKLIRKSFLTEYEIAFPDHLAYEDIFWGNLVNLYLRSGYIIEEKLYHYFVNENSIVLRKNAEHHMDHLTVQEMTWEEWMRRGFYESFRDELEYEYFYNGYLAMLKILIYRFDEPSYSVFRLLQMLTTEKLPNYPENPYMKEQTVPPMHRILAESIYAPLTRQQFAQLAEDIRTVGI